MNWKPAGCDILGVAPADGSRIIGRGARTTTAGAMIEPRGDGCGRGLPSPPSSLEDGYGEGAMSFPRKKCSNLDLKYSTCGAYWALFPVQLAGLNAI